MEKGRSVGRPKQFDPEAAIDRATAVFQEKGFAGASTGDLLQAMQIGRQSFYDTFHSKRSLYLTALRRHCRERAKVHIRRLNSDHRPLKGVEAMLTGLATDQDAAAQILEVGSIAEFGCSDTEVTDCRLQSLALVHGHLVDRLNEAKRVYEIFQAADCQAAARFVETTMYGFQVAARAGVSATTLESLAKYAVEAVIRTA
jgi:AcrR family transcriptional regulator